MQHLLGVRLPSSSGVGASGPDQAAGVQAAGREQVQD